MNSPGIISVTEWSEARLHRQPPGTLEASFGDWLAERLDVEQRATMKEMQDIWQTRYNRLQADVTEAFHQSVKPTTKTLPRPRTPVLVPSVPATADETKHAPETPLLGGQATPVSVIRKGMGKGSKPAAQTIGVVRDAAPDEKNQFGMSPQLPDHGKLAQTVTVVVDVPAEEAPDHIPSQPVESTPILSLEPSPLTIASKASSGQKSHGKSPSQLSKGPSGGQGANNGCGPFESACWNRLEVLFGAGIMLNAVVMLIEEQYRGLDAGFALNVDGFSDSAEKLFPHGQGTFDVLNVLFNMLFTLELACRLRKARRNFYRSVWIWLDLIVVPVAWLDIVGVIRGFQSFTAMIRIFRVIRLLQLLESMRRFEKLNVLIQSIKGSFHALMWCMTIILFTQIVAALWLHYTLKDFYVDNSRPEAARRMVFERFGTASRTMLTMFQIIFSNWSQPCWMLVIHVSEWYGLFFVLYRCVLGFAILHVVSSMFNAETHKICNHDKDVGDLMRKSEAETHKRRLLEIFSEVDSSGDGNVSWSELQGMLENDKLLGWLRHLGIKPLHLTELFKVLRQGSGNFEEDYVDLAEFAAGALNVEGTAKSIDVLAICKALDRVTLLLDDREAIEADEEREASFSSLPFGTLLDDAPPAPALHYSAAAQQRSPASFSAIAQQRSPAHRRSPSSEHYHVKPLGV